MFLNALRRSKAPVSIFLTKGVRLQGAITGFDSFSVELRRGPSAQLLYKHAISTISPQRVPEGFTIDAAAMGSPAGLQDLFLDSVMRGGESVSLYLVNGVMLDGIVAGYDQYVVLLGRAGIAQMVYKHAISTLQPAATPAVATAEPEVVENDA